MLDLDCSKNAESKWNYIPTNPDVEDTYSIDEKKTSNENEFIQFNSILSVYWGG